MSTLTATLYGVPLMEMAATPNGGLRVVRWYDDSLAAWGSGSTMISVSMPVGDRIADNVVTNFFDNLMPEVRRDQLSAALGIDDSSLFSLLSAIGMDCAGAISVAPTGAAPHEREGGTLALTDADLATLVRDLPRRPLGLSAHVRHSLAGLQGKLLLVRRVDDGWALAVDGQPSTYILKPEPVDLPVGMAGNELLCTRLARACGLTDVDSFTLNVEGHHVFATSRFDRFTDEAGAIRRIHQEDLCQVFGRTVGDKYERPGEGVLAKTATLLSRRARRVDVVDLARMVTFNVAIGNTDAHCKNVALLHHPDSTIALAPIYDVAHLAGLGRSLEPGMLVGDIRSILMITGGDLVEEIAGWKARVNRRDSGAIVATTLVEILDTLDEVASDVWVDESIVDAIRERTQALHASLP